MTPRKPLMPRRLLDVGFPAMARPLSAVNR